MKTENTLEKISKGELELAEILNKIYLFKADIAINNLGADVKLNYAILIMKRLIRVIENSYEITNKNDLGVIKSANDFISGNFNVSNILRNDKNKQ